MTDETGIEAALKLARRALAAGEPPFGALIVDRSGQIVAEATDQVHALRDFTRHAEIEAVRAACARLGPDLTGCTLYTTCEPCPMCFTAAWLARVSCIVWGTTMAKVAGLVGSAQRELAVPAPIMNTLSGQPIELHGGVLDDACLALFWEIK